METHAVRKGLTVSSVVFAIVLFAAASTSAEAVSAPGTLRSRERPRRALGAEPEGHKYQQDLPRASRRGLRSLRRLGPRLALLRWIRGRQAGASRALGRRVGPAVSRPAERPQPALPKDPRIAKDAFPKVGQSGLTEQDIRTLYQGALKFLECGKCRRVEYGDKSASKPNTYFINCGGPNLFFTPADLR